MKSSTFSFLNKVDLKSQLSKFLWLLYVIVFEFIFLKNDLTTVITSLLKSDNFVSKRFLSWKQIFLFVKKRSVKEFDAKIITFWHTG